MAKMYPVSFSRSEKTYYGQGMNYVSPNKPYIQMGGRTSRGTPARKKKSSYVPQIRRDSGIQPFSRTTYRPQSRINFGGIMQSMQSSSAAARAANLKRLGEVKGIYDEIINRYRPGGGFGAGFEAQLERAKGRDVASGTQALVSSGLYGTTQTAGLGKKWEEEVGAPARLKLEDLRMDRLSEAQRGKAGVIERVEDQYPDYAMLANLMRSASSAPQSSVSRVNKRKSWSTGFGISYD